MKRLILVGSAALCVLLMASCKSSESAYKKAYDKAKQQELAQTSEPTIQAPVDVAPVVQPTAPVVVNTNESVRQEKVTVASGNDANFKDYSVICGSFGLKTNAEGLRNFLISEGYNPVILYNQEKGMYRVAMGSYSDKAEAIQARNAFKSRFPNREDFQGSWILNRL